MLFPMRRVSMRTALWKRGGLHFTGTKYVEGVEEKWSSFWQSIIMAFMKRFYIFKTEVCWGIIE